MVDDSTSIRPRSRRRAGRTGCAVEATLSVIGGVWKPVLLFHLLSGKLRFNALCRLTPSATARMITLQLRELEADGIVRRAVSSRSTFFHHATIGIDHPCHTTCPSHAT